MGSTGGSVELGLIYPWHDIRENVGWKTGLQTYRPWERVSSAASCLEENRLSVISVSGTSQVRF